MDCDKAIYRVYELPRRRADRLAALDDPRHLDECPPCAQGFDFEIELRQVIVSKCRDDVPPELKRRIAKALGAPLPPEESGPAAGSV